MPDWRFWLPMTVSVFAAGFTALQWSESRQQRQLSVRPSLTFMIEDDDAESTVGIALESHGPGPAVIQSVTYYADRKPLKSDDEAAAYCKLDTKLLRLMEFDPGDTFGPNQTDWLFARGTKNKKELDKFLDCVDDHVAVEVAYCSIDGSWCRTKCSSEGSCK